MSQKLTQAVKALENQVEHLKQNLKEERFINNKLLEHFNERLEKLESQRNSNNPPRIRQPSGKNTGKSKKAASKSRNNNRGQPAPNTSSSV